MVRAPQSWLAQELGGSDPVDEDDDRRRVIRGSGRRVRIVSVLPVTIRGIDTARDVSACALRDRCGHQLQREVELPAMRLGHAALPPSTLQDEGAQRRTVDRLF